MANIKIYKRLAKSLAQLVSLSKMYNVSHPLVKDKTEAVYKEVCDFFSNNKQSIVFAKSADMLLINGEKIDPEDKLMMRFIEDFVSLEVGSMELGIGLSRDEFDVFIQIMCSKERIAGAEKLKQFLTEKKVSHLVARAATFKLVQENESIVKKGEFIKVEEVRPEVLEKFSKDFTEGKVTGELKKADKDYVNAAHNSTFLTELTFDLMKSKDTPEDLEKVLWLLADYLIEEIDSFKEEDMNRKVLEDIKKKLLLQWKDKQEKKETVQQLEKTYAVINTALQLKGLMAIYKKHKKELEVTVARLKEILHNLPPDSQLYKKAIDDLAGLGPTSINENTFK
jgi:hypothetical protein